MCAQIEKEQLRKAEIEAEKQLALRLQVQIMEAEAAAKREHNERLANAAATAEEQVVMQPSALRDIH
jgi:hypothetical protein